MKRALLFLLVLVGGLVAAVGCGSDVTEQSAVDSYAEQEKKAEKLGGGKTVNEQN